MKKPELMIFDMDGLMFDTERLCMDVYKEAAAPYGYEITETFYKKTLGTNGTILKQITFQEFGDAYPYEELDQITTDRMIAHIKQHGLPVKPGLPELLTVLKDNKTPCYVASSTYQGEVELYLDKAGIRSYFSHIIGGDMVSATKPDPEIFRKCLEHAGCPANRALILEDSENGILAASRAGIPVICIPDMKYPEPEYAALTDQIMDSLSDVADLLRH